MRRNIHFEYYSASNDENTRILSQHGAARMREHISQCSRQTLPSAPVQRERKKEHAVATVTGTATGGGRRERQRIFSENQSF